MQICLLVCVRDKTLMHNQRTHISFSKSHLHNTNETFQVANLYGQISTLRDVINLFYHTESSTSYSVAFSMVSVYEYFEVSYTYRSIVWNDVDTLQWHHNECHGFSNHWHIQFSTACSTICSGAHQRTHQSSTSLAFVRGIHQWLVYSPQKGPVMQRMFPYDDVIIKMSPECSICTVLCFGNISILANGCIDKYPSEFLW